MGIGAYPAVSLANARKRAAECRELVASRIDPIDQRKETRTRAALAKAKAMTFKQAAEAYVDAQQAGWRSAKHRKQWVSSLERFVYPVFGNLPVQDIDLGLVLKVIEPIWKAKPTTASRVRGRIEAVLDWSTVRGLRTGHNPATWRGHISQLLPAKSKIRKVRPYPALPYQQIGTFMANLRRQLNVSARALELIILTAVRANEGLAAEWPEIDFDARTWTIPGDRMKSGLPHRVPLSDAAVRVLRVMAQLRQNNLIFPGAKAGRPVSETALLLLLARMGHGDITVHGFRSSFRDWAAEQTNFPREVAEMALAHAVGDETEAAYMRTDLLEKRKRLMAAWADYCAKPAKKSSASAVSMSARRLE
jgi:integrase